MDKEYKKVVVSIIVIAVVVVVIGVFYIYKQKTKFSSLEENIVSFLEEYSAVLMQQFYRILSSFVELFSFPIQECFVIDSPNG